MSYCLNPNCQKPENNPHDKFCLSCGNNLLLNQRYRAIKTIGQGNFGRTILAVDTDDFSKDCVIKQFLPQAQGTDNIEKAAELFEQEAERLNNLGKHNQIPDLIDYLTDEEHQYLVQEYIDGQNLDKILKTEGIFNEQQIWELLKSLLAVLEFIHQNDIIHRDIKPENIISDKNGKLYLVDFGAAKVVTGTAILQTGTSIGTPEFVAPEQSRGKAIYSSDLYSLGTTCIYLLTGVSPFDLFDISEYKWVWRQYLVDNPVSEKLGNILDKLIDNATSRRYQLAGEVITYIKNQSLNNKVSKNISYSSNWQEFYNKGIFDRFKHVQNLIITDTTISQDGIIFAALAYYKEQRGSFKTGWRTVYSLQLSSIDPIVKINLNIENKNPINTVAISPDNNIVAIGDRDSNIKLWNIHSGKEIHRFKGWYGAINCVSFSPNGKLIASGGNDETIKFWDVRNGSEVRTLKNDNKVNSIAFSNDGKIIASGCDDGKTILWDLNTGRRLRTLQDINIRAGISSVAFSPDGKLIATANKKKYIKLWKVNTGKEICHFTSHSSFASKITFNIDGNLIASCSKDGDVNLWNINTKQKIFAISTDIKSLIFQNQQQREILIGVNYKIRKFKDMDKSYSSANQKYYWQGIDNFISHTACIDSIAISPSGKILASGSHDKTIKLWEISTGKEIHSIETKHSIYALTFSPDGLIIASGDSKNNIYFWDVNSGEKIRILKGHTGRFAGVNSIAFSPDNKIIASAGGDKTVKLWDVTTGAEIRTLQGHHRWVSSVTFSPDGNIIASGSADYTANFWELNTGEIINTFKHQDEIRSITFSPDGKIFATGSNDYTIKLWQVSNGEEICILKGHESSIRYITFDPSGKLIASSSYNDDIKLWDVDIQEEIFSLKGYSGKVNSIVFSPDGQTLFSGSNDSNIKVWQKIYLDDYNNSDTSNNHSEDIQS